MKTLPKERRYETLSYLPPLSDSQIAKQLQYILDQGYIPGVEFNETSAAEMRYWTMWKLPLFGARSVQEIICFVGQLRSGLGTPSIPFRGGFALDRTRRNDHDVGWM